MKSLALIKLESSFITMAARIHGWPGLTFCGWQESFLGFWIHSSRLRIHSSGPQDSLFLHSFFTLSGLRIQSFWAPECTLVY